MSDKTEITPDTKVGQLLESYPELKEILFEISPAFRKLNNPVLLKTVAKVTSLKQAAQVGKVSLPEMINKLRMAVGLNKIEIIDNQSSSSDKKPDWFTLEKVVETLDARSMIDNGEQPISIVLGRLKKLMPGTTYELIAPFAPAPLIDKVDQQKYAVYINEEKNELVRTYFYRK